jgi:RNA polymerase sigma factor (sigma-70 family)
MDLDEALRALRAEEPKAREQFGRALRTELQRFFSNCFGPIDAHELTQATCVVVLEKLDRFESRGPGSFERWVYKIAANKARVRRQSPTREAARQGKLLAHQAMVSPLNSPTTWMLRRERLELLEHCKPNLPDHERRALEHALAGGDERSLAEQEGIAEATARSRKHRAKVHIVELLAVSRKTPDSERTPTAS